MMARFILLGIFVVLSLSSVPVQAQDDESLNSGFGVDLFSGRGHPAFDDPSFHDPDDLNAIAPGSAVSAIEPAAGDETDDAAAVDDVVDKPRLVPGVKGLRSFSTAQ